MPVADFASHTIHTRAPDTHVLCPPTQTRSYTTIAVGARQHHAAPDARQLYRHPQPLPDHCGQLLRALVSPLSLLTAVCRILLVCRDHHPLLNPFLTPHPPHHHPQQPTTSTTDSSKPNNQKGATGASASSPRGKLPPRRCMPSTPKARTGGFGLQRWTAPRWVGFSH
jgi:hypothetical protein